MQLGLFTPLFGTLPLDEMLVRLKEYPSIKMLEIGTGGWPGAAHIDVEALLGDRNAAKTYRSKIHDAGLGISALSCHGNPVHPQKAIAERDDATLRRTIQLAELLEVPIVVTFSGCPGGSSADTTPNWITTGWPPELAKALEWQWDHCLYPYWTQTALYAASCGVGIALEAHPGFCVYNTETLLRLRNAAGPSLGINLDPSHLWWQGMDIPCVISELGDAIFHVHAKDVLLNPLQIARNGVLDSKSYKQMQQRSWTFRSVGWGHDALAWKTIISSLRLSGYDYAISIEHEDGLASIDQGLSSAITMLEGAILRNAPAEAWWA